MDDDFKETDFAKFSMRRDGAQPTSEKLAAVPSEHDSDGSMDGRISRKAGRDGRIQLNVKVPIHVKELLLFERARRRRERVPKSDVNAIVIEAIERFLRKA